MVAPVLDLARGGRSVYLPRDVRANQRLEAAEMIILLVLALLSDVRPLTREQICATRWGVDRRFVTEAMKQEVARRAGIPRASIVGRGRGSCCEIDHIVPRELGGA